MFFSRYHEGVFGLKKIQPMRILSPRKFWETIKTGWTLTEKACHKSGIQFIDEPRHTDFREIKSAAHLSVRNPNFRAAVADVASTLLGRSKDELFGEDVRRYRQTKQIAWSTAITLS